MESQRRLDIDVASGIMICWMMLRHVMTSAGDNLVAHTYPYLVSITIPFFLYKAGMLCRAGSVDVKKLASKLIIPYAIFSLCGIVLTGLVMWSENTFTLAHYLKFVTKTILFEGGAPNNMPMWYLPTFFLVLITAKPFLAKTTVFLPSYVYLIIGGILLSFVHCLCPFSYPHGYIPYLFGNYFSCVAFFALGYWLKDYHYKWQMVILALCGYLIFMFFGMPVVNAHSNTLIHGHYLSWFPLSCCAIILLLNAVKCITDRLGRRSIIVRVFEFVGLIVMTFYCIHRLIVHLNIRLIYSNILHGESYEWKLIIGLISIFIIMPAIVLILNYYKKREKQTI